MNYSLKTRCWAKAVVLAVCLSVVSGGVCRAWAAEEQAAKQAAVKNDIKTIVLLADDFEGVEPGRNISATTGKWQGNDADALPAGAVFDIGLGNTLAGRVHLVAGRNGGNDVTSNDGEKTGIDRKIKFKDKVWQKWRICLDIDKGTYEYAVDGVKSGPLKLRDNGGEPIRLIEIEPGTAGDENKKDSVLYLDDVRVEYQVAAEQVAKLKKDMEVGRKQRQRMAKRLAAAKALIEAGSNEAYYLYAAPQNIAHRTQLFLDPSAYARPQALAANERRYGGENVRTRISVTLSQDMKNWTTARHVLVPDELDRSDKPGNKGYFFDRMAALKYGNQYLGFLAVQPRHAQDKGHIELTSNSDGFRWHRSPLRESFISPGKEGEWDAGHTWMLTNVVPVGHWLHLYYVGSSQTWRTRFPANTKAIGLARIRRDRFVGQYPARLGRPKWGTIRNDLIDMSDFLPALAELAAFEPRLVASCCNCGVLTWFTKLRRDIYFPNLKRALSPLVEADIIAMRRCSLFVANNQKNKSRSSFSRMRRKRSSNSVLRWSRGSFCNSSSMSFSPAERVSSEA